MRRLARDERAETSSGFRIFIIIAIALAVWHFGSPYLGIPSWVGMISDYTTEDTPVELSFDWDFYDRTSLQILNMSSIAEYDHSFGTALNDVWNNRVEEDFTDDTLGWNVENDNAIANYEIVIRTNAPASLFSPRWTVSITGSDNPYRFWSGGYQYIPREFKSWDIITGTGDKEFRYQLDPDLCTVSHTFGEWTYFRMTITNPQGQIVFQDNMFIW